VKDGLVSVGGTATLYSYGLRHCYLANPPCSPMEAGVDRIKPLFSMDPDWMDSLQWYWTEEYGIAEIRWERIDLKSLLELSSNVLVRSITQYLLCVQAGLTALENTLPRRSQMLYLDNRSYRFSRTPCAVRTILYYGCKC
jgi:hypothetical protein